MCMCVCLYVCIFVCMCVHYYEESENGFIKYILIKHYS